MGSSFEEGSGPSAAARASLGAEDGSFAVVLVGGDSGEKHRSAEPVALGELFDLVDAMRRREVREKGAG